ncbi:MAG: hypothetical protein GY866_04805 [Proteobacteria bacterium]|nr:hypothetical protein [Pseudomonadota bacterium]
MNNRLLWRHYFFDLPLFALGFRPRRLKDRDRLTGDHRLVIEGVKYLQKRMGERFSPAPAEQIARRINQVRLVRESDSFAALLITRKNLHKWVRIEGFEALEEASRENRPVVLLGGHLGSNYIMWIALDKLGLQVYPIARAVDPTPGTPRARKAYMHLTYFLTSLKWRGRYLMADSVGHFPRGRFSRMIERVFRGGGICFAAIDFPSALYTGKQEMVSFLGAHTPLPISLIHLCLEKNAHFFTILEGVEFHDSRIIRRIRLSPINDVDGAGEILQVYADRMTSFICREPWQWMGLAVAGQYRPHEAQS